MGSNNETAFAKTMALLAAIAAIVAVVIAILAWLMPFSPIGSSPLAPSPTASITTYLNSPDVNSTIAAIFLEQTSIASQQSPIFPTAEPSMYPTYTPYPIQEQPTRYMPPPITVVVVAPTSVPPTVVPPTQTTVSTQSFYLDIFANQEWQGTGIRVNAQDIVSISYLSGQWSIWQGSSLDPPTDGNGHIGRQETCALMPQADISSLIGRIADNQPFFIGNGTSFRSSYSGDLSFSINDCWGTFQDNGGSLTLMIRVGP